MKKMEFGFAIVFVIVHSGLYSNAHKILPFMCELYYLDAQ